MAGTAPVHRKGFGRSADRHHAMPAWLVCGRFYFKSKCKVFDKIVCKI